MPHKHQKINFFEMATVGMIAAGFIVVGVILFSNLTPRQQAHIGSAMSMFDIHEQAAASFDGMVNTVQFVWDSETEYFNQFYIAFAQVATIPSENFELPVQVASEIKNDFALIWNNLGDQIAAGYRAQNNLQMETRAYAVIEIPTPSTMIQQGVVLGATVDFSEHLPDANQILPDISPPEKELTMPYSYEEPKWSELKTLLTKILN